MFRKNFTLSYKLYAKNLQALKSQVLFEGSNASASHYKNLIEKVIIPSQCTDIIQAAKVKINTNYQQLLKDVTAAAENTINKCAVYTSIANGKLQDTKKSKMELVKMKASNLYNTKHELQKLIKNKICSVHLKENESNSLTSQNLKTITLRSRIAACSAAGLVATSEEAAKVTETPTLIIEPIPEPPPIPDPGTFTETISQLNALGEPTFASLGLGGWTPVGMVQNSLEYLHVSLDLPWWGAIAIGTVIVRLLMFPLVVIAQRNAAKMNNYLPQLQAIQLKMTEARQCGNQIDVARYSQEMMIFMKEKDLNPLKNMIVPLAQMPLFISFFIGLRKMANLPVDSLREGGMFWFTDLTVPDQYFALPIITSLTLWTTIELGTDSARLSSQNLQTMKYVLRALPLVILPFTVNFPGAILCYWVASNFISLAQVGFLRIPSVRDYFKIEPLIKHDPQKMPVQRKGFVGGIKDSWTNVKITRELEERRRFDELQFQRAGRGPIVKTYKYDPTKQMDNNPNAINAKKR